MSGKGEDLRGGGGKGGDWQVRRRPAFRGGIKRMRAPRPVRTVARRENQRPARTMEPALEPGLGDSSLQRYLDGEYWTLKNELRRLLGCCPLFQHRYPAAATGPKHAQCPAPHPGRLSPDAAPPRVLPTRPGVRAAPELGLGPSSLTQRQALRPERAWGGVTRCPKSGCRGPRLPRALRYSGCKISAVPQSPNPRPSGFPRVEGGNRSARVPGSERARGVSAGRVGVRSGRVCASRRRWFPGYSHSPGFRSGRRAALVQGKGGRDPRGHLIPAARGVAAGLGPLKSVSEGLGDSSPDQNAVSGGRGQKRGTRGRG